MITTRLYLDCRHKEQNKPMPLKLCICKKGSTAYIPLGVEVLPGQWNSKTQKIGNHVNKKALNTFIENRKTEIDNLIMRLTNEGKLAGLSAVQVKNIIKDELDPDVDVFSSPTEAAVRHSAPVNCTTRR